MERPDCIVVSLAAALLTACGSGGSNSSAPEQPGEDAGGQPAPSPDAGASSNDAGTSSNDAAAEGGGPDGRAPGDAGMPTSVPNHFPSASYAYQYGAWMSADPADVRYYLTFAEVPFAKRDTCNNTLADGDCFSLMYMDTDIIYLAAAGAPSGCASVGDGSHYGSLPETSFVHASGTSVAAADRLRGYYGTMTGADSATCPVLGYAGFDGDTSDGGLLSVWQGWEKANDDGKLGGFFHDDFGSDSFEGYLKGGTCPPFTGTDGAGTVICQTALEYPDAAALEAAHHTFLEQLTRPTTGKPMPTLYNGCPEPSGPSYYTSGVLVNPVSFETDPATQSVALGCEAEGVLSSSAPATVDQIPGTGVYAKNVATLLNDISLVASPTFSYMLLDYGDPDASLRLNERYFDLGVEWLAYQPGTRNVVQFDDIDWDATDTDELFPEQMLVPWGSTNTMTPFDATAKSHGEHDLRVDSFEYKDANGNAVDAAMYCREFASLYQGHLRTEAMPPTRIGSGAVCVNTSDAARPILAGYLKQPYGYVVTFPAGAIDVQGATLDFTTPFVAGQTTVGAGSAAFLLGT